MARAGAYFAAAGAFTGLVSLVLPGSSVRDEKLLAVAIVAAAVGAAALLLGYDRIPRAGFHVAAALGTLLTTLAVYAWGTGSSFAPLPYLWVAIFVFYFFSRAQALGHLALLGVAYAVALAVEDPPGSGVDGWFDTVATLAVAGLFLQLVRDRAGGLIASLSESVRRDPLTELLNRRGFDELFDIEVERGRRAGLPLSVVAIDIDRFKAFNDSYGHPAGDAALQQIARCIDDVKRSFDAAARIGGEEFALLAVDSGEHGAYMLAERVRIGIEQELAAHRTPLTVSAGIATFPLHGQTTEALMHAADQALYAAKRLGRNRTVISSAEVPAILGRSPRRAEAHVDLGALLSLAEALDVRELGSASHCHRVGRFAELTARELGLPPDAVERMRLAGILHDVGRVGVPEALMRKPGPLDDREWELVRAHPEVGARLLDATDFDDIRLWVLEHHERPDGGGYPRGLTDEVPLEARILAVADAYEAMTSERPYRPALSTEQAAEELRRGAGRQFDARVVEALLRVV